MSGKIIWRVGYNGPITPYKVLEVCENGDFVMGLLPPITKITDFDYAIIELSDKEYFGKSTFNPKTCSSAHEFFDDLELAKDQSLVNFEKEVNPNASYRVARYFDDVFEAYETGPLSKRDAIERRKQLNATQRHYVSYRAVVSK